MAAGLPLGTRIRRARERKRWTQRELADALGVNVKSVDNWENGRTSPRSSVGAIEAVLGISLDAADEAAAAIIPARLRRVIMEELPDPEDQRRVIGLLEKTLTRDVSGSSEPAAGQAADEPEGGERLRG